MIFVQEKLKHNIIVLVFTVIGFITTEIILILAWVTVITSADQAISGGILSQPITLNIGKILIPVGLTIFFSYTAGNIVRGLERKSHGLDLHSMDEAEIDVEVALLEKEKRSRQRLSLVDARDLQVHESDEVTVKRSKIK